ncbi:MAG: RNA polymerase sigma factor, partial [Longimicrobiales bacterium]
MARQHLSDPEPEPGVSHAGAEPSIDTLSPAIEQHVRRWQGLVQRAARRYGLLGQDEEELTQDLRIRIWRALSRGGENPKGIGSSYVYQAAMSAAVDLLRRRRSERAAHTAPLDQLQDVIAAPAMHAIDETDLSAALEQALSTLASDRRVVVRMHLDG